MKYEIIYRDDWAMYNYGQKIDDLGKKGIDINILPAWTITQGKEEVIVAVVDTGVDVECDIFDDIKIVGGWDFYNNDETIYDEYIHDYHGTYVCTTIAKVAPKITILPIKFMESTSGTVEDAIEGISYAISKGAKVINCSWNFYDYSEDLYGIIKENPDVLFVCAAGNYNVDIDKISIYPCSYQLDNIINVLAIDNTGQVYSTSGYGRKTVDLAAPGKSVKVILPENDEAYVDGTSVATAFVSATAALLLSSDERLDAYEIKQIILSSVQQIDAIQTKCVSGGIIDVYATLQHK